MDHEPSCMDYRRNDERQLPTFEELIQSAPGEYLNGEPFVDEKGVRQVLRVTDSHVQSALKS